MGDIWVTALAKYMFGVVTVAFRVLSRIIPPCWFHSIYSLVCYIHILSTSCLFSFLARSPPIATVALCALAFAFILCSYCGHLYLISVCMAFPFVDARLRFPDMHSPSSNMASCAYFLKQNLELVFSAPFTLTLDLPHRHGRPAIRFESSILKPTLENRTTRLKPIISEILHQYSPGTFHHM